jgi:hypothetical protein
MTCGRRARPPALMHTVCALAATLTAGSIVDLKIEITANHMVSSTCHSSLLLALHLSSPRLLVLRVAWPAMYIWASPDSCFSEGFSLCYVLPNLHLLTQQGGFKFRICKLTSTRSQDETSQLTEACLNQYELQRWSGCRKRVPHSMTLERDWTLDMDCWTAGLTGVDLGAGLT